MAKRVRSIVSVTGFVFVLLAAAGCAAPAATRAESTETSISSQSEAADEASPDASDPETCEALSDVLTVVHNATVAHNQDRMTDQEYGGWLRLATRLLADLSVSDEGGVAEDVKALQAKAPSVPAGSTASTPIGDTNWMDGVDISTQCEAAGSPVQIAGFVGG